MMNILKKNPTPKFCWAAIILIVTWFSDIVNLITNVIAFSDSGYSYDSLLEIFSLSIFMRVVTLFFIVVLFIRKLNLLTLGTIVFYYHIYYYLQFIYLESFLVDAFIDMLIDSTIVAVAAVSILNLPEKITTIVKKLWFVPAVLIALDRIFGWIIDGVKITAFGILYLALNVAFTLLLCSWLANPYKKGTQPAVQPAVQPTAQPVAQPVAPQYVQQPVAQPVAQQYVQQPIAQQYVQQPIAQQYVQQPVAQPVAQQYVEQPVAQPIAQQYVQQPVAQPVAQPAPQTAGFVDIDWQRYAPLEAGVSFNPSKDYKFHRAEGFVGSVPQTFVNRTYPKCPICCSTNPYWTIAQHNQMSWKGNLYLFKCSACDGIISMSMPDVTTLGNGGAGVAANPTVGLTNLLVKSKSGKEAGAVYAVIESVGRSGVNPICQGKEFKLEQLQEISNRM